MYKQLQIFRPTITSRITQPWGVNGACIDISGKGPITNAKNDICPIGKISFYKSIGMLGHSGIDISSFIGENIYHAATFDGWMQTEYDNAGGIGVDVVSNKPLFFKGVPPKEIKDTAVLVDGGFTHYVKMRYWHLKSPVGHDGKQVTCGMIVGLSGNTGASSGPHLHFAPKWCASDGRGVGTENGYFGAFDPTPYYNHNIVAKDHGVFLVGTKKPTEQELKDMQLQLSLLQKMLRLLQELKHNV